MTSSRGREGFSSYQTYSLKGYRICLFASLVIFLSLLDYSIEFLAILAPFELYRSIGKVSEPMIVRSYKTKSSCQCHAEDFESFYLGFPFAQHILCCFQ